MKKPKSEKYPGEYIQTFDSYTNKDHLRKEMEDLKEAFSTGDGNQFMKALDQYVLSRLQDLSADLVDRVKSRGQYDRDY